jgi:hypothetical protein
MIEELLVAFEAVRGRLKLAPKRRSDGVAG